MFAEHERELLVAEDAAAFAREVVRLYQDEELWNRLSDASVSNVEEHFSITAARNRADFFCRGPRKHGQLQGENWRKRVGVEPTPDGRAARHAVLKTGRATGPHPLPLAVG